MPSRAPKVVGVNGDPLSTSGIAREILRQASGAPSSFQERTRERRSKMGSSKNGDAVRKMESSQNGTPFLKMELLSKMGSSNKWNAIPNWVQNGKPFQNWEFNKSVQHGTPNQNGTPFQNGEFQKWMPLIKSRKVSTRCGQIS